VVIFIEVPSFTDQISDLVDDAVYLEFQKQLLGNPKKGDVISHSGGLRKARMKLPGRGKSGGARVIYLHLEEREIIVFFYVYTKAKSENLTPEQLKRLRAAVAVIKQEFKS
jgi:mRNA-degrading endonuclease RelE of RelBE toxin-antitoxin system